MHVDKLDIGLFGIKSVYNVWIVANDVVRSKQG
jgi:hypothetical protein